MAAKAELGVLVTFTREPDEEEATIVADRLAKWMKGATVLDTTAGRTRIGVVDAEVTDWNDVK